MTGLDPVIFISVQEDGRVEPTAVRLRSRRIRFSLYVG
jgi:hypothetical protein